MKHKLLAITLAVAAGSMSFYLLPDNSNEASYVPRDAEKSAEWQGAAEYLRAIRANQHTGEIDPADVLKMRQQVAEFSNRAAVGFNWEFKGPDNIGGRTRAILVDLTDPTGNTVWVGSVSGGVFKSTDGAGTWNRVEELDPNLIVASMAQAPNGDIYVGTGSSFDGPSGIGGSGFIGTGMYRLKNGATQWDFIVGPSSPNTTSGDWVEINKIVIDPNNSNIIYACMNAGLRVSTDAGQTWINPIYLQTGCQTSVLGTGQDILITNDGRVVVAIGGRIYWSDNGTQDCSYSVAADSPFIGGRVEVEVAPTDNNYMYAMVTSSGKLTGVWQSTDKGDNWNLILIPIGGYFEPMGSNSQGWYDMLLGVAANDPGKIYMGGVEMWAWDGNLTHAAAEFGGYPYYIHADKHAYANDPHDPTGKTLYIGTDGGIFKSDDGGQTFYEANRGYSTTQFYGIAHITFDTLKIPFGGTQDNGTILIPGFGGNTIYEGFNIFGGDGFDCDASQISPAIFASSQYSYIGRANVQDQQNLSFALICSTYCEPPDQGRPFFSRVRLWETLDDPFSQDSIIFSPDTNDLPIGTGNDFKRTFTGTLQKTQATAKFVASSIFFTAGLSLIENFDGDGQMNGPNGTGQIDSITGEFTIRFTTAPSMNTVVYSHFAERFDAGDQVMLTSNTAGIQIPYTCFVSLDPGDTIIIQDPVQSLFAFQSTSGNIEITREGLDFAALQPDLIKLTTSAGTVNCMEFSTDGNYLFVGTMSGSVVRFSGLSQVYKQSDVIPTNQVSIKGYGRPVTGISVHPTDPNQLVVTLGGYGNTDYVYLITDATTAIAGNANSISKQTNLPAMPVYDAELDVLDNNIVVIGTEMGIWATDNFFGACEWSDESGNVGHVPVFDIRQQRWPWNIVPDHETYYIGTHGRGIWMSETLVGIDNKPVQPSEDFVSDLVVYPNPSGGESYLKFDLKKGQEGQINVFDMNGRLVKSLNQSRFKAGTNKIKLDVRDLKAGTYFVTLEAGNVKKVNKFVLVK